MKKAYLFFLVLAIVLSSATLCLAQEAPFSLRNGYAWGMSKADAYALASMEGLILAQEYGSEMMFHHVPVGQYNDVSLTLRFANRDSGLYWIYYSFPSVGQEDLQPMFEDIKASLTGIYGTPYTMENGPLVYWLLSDTEIRLDKVRVIGQEKYFCYLSYRYIVPVRNAGF